MLQGGPLRAQEATASLEVWPGSPGRVRLSAPGLSWEAECDARGAASFLQLPPGSYALTAGAGCPQTVAILPGEQRIVRCSGSASDASEASAPLPEQGLTGPDAVTLFDASALRTFPRPADPWSVLRDVPGVVVDRVNVGGSDSEQQSLLLSKGDPGTGATWSFDGVDLTDPAALGTSLAYPDLDALHSLAARTSAADVRVRTPGVQVGLAFRAPEPRLTGAAHLRGSWGGLQSKNLPDSLQGRPFFRNSTERVSEAGAELGGPAFRGRGWLWGAAFVNALDQETFTEHRESLRTGGFTAKGRLQLGSGTLSLRTLYADKRHEDRDTGLSTTHAARWRQSGPTWMLAAEDVRPLRGFSLLSHVSWVDGGFRLEPYGGPEPSSFEDFRGILQRSYTSFGTDRARLRGGVEAQKRLHAWGGEHTLLLGLSGSHAPVETHQGWPGNGVQGLERRGVFFQTFRLTGFATPYRESVSRAFVNGLSAQLADEVHFGSFTAQLGLRLERLSGGSEPSSVRANPAFPELLPAASYDGQGQGVTWLDLLPRAALAMELHPRLTASIGYAAYAAPLGVGEVAFDDPFRDFSSVTYYWKDLSDDGVVQPGELDLTRGRVGASGLDPDNPAAGESPNRIDPELRAPRTHELFAAADFRFGATTRASARATWRRMTDALWRPLRNLTLADYVARGSVSGTLFEDEYDVVYFAPVSASQIVPGNGRVLANREGYAQETFVVEGQAEGRLGAGAAWRAWAAYVDGRERFEDRGLAVQDPTPTESDPLRDGGPPVVRPGGLGRGDLFVGARFVGGASLNVRLPVGFETAGVLHLREGFPVPYYQIASTGDPTAGSKNLLVSTGLDQYRQPGLVLLDLRLSRAFRLGRGRLTVGLDVWNATNSAATLQTARDVELPAFNRAREIVRPRLVRLGFDWRF